MVGRTPEYLGKKIGQREIVLVALYVLATPALVLVGTAVAITTDAGLAGLQESGPHGLSEALYAVTSAANNNGSAFGGLTSGTPFWNTLLGLCMLAGRFLPIVFVLALAGRFATQQKRPDSAGTLPTHRPLFVVLLTGVALVLVGLTYVPRARPRSDRGVPVMTKHPVHEITPPAAAPPAGRTRCPKRSARWSPRSCWHHPVMFVVEIGAVVTTVATVVEPVGRSRPRSPSGSG